MSERKSLNCANHSNRIALEECEVCQKSLCAYCLYYTEDGQRLCETHAEKAHAMGVQIEAPAKYADQLIGAQVEALRKQKRDHSATDEKMYIGNSNDMVSLIGLMIGAGTLSLCCGVGNCLPLVGFVLSLVALFNAKKAHDPQRTRRMGWIGLLASSVWILIIAICIVFYGLAFSRGFYSNRTSISSVSTVTPTPTSPTMPPGGISGAAWGNRAPGSEAMR